MPRQFEYNFCCGEAGGIAAAAAMFGIKALELCDDLSDAWEDGDADFLRQILNDLRERPDIGAATNPEPRSAASLAVLSAALAEAVMARRAGDPRRFALMSGFGAGLMFAEPEPGPQLTEAEIVEEAIRYCRGMAESGELEAALVDDVVSGELRSRLEAVVGTRDDRTITTRDAVTRACQADLVELTIWLQRRIVGGARHTDPMSSMSSNDEAERCYQEEVQTMRWVQNFGLRRARAREQVAAIPGYMQVNRAVRQMNASEPDADPPSPIEMCYWVVPGRLLAGEYPRNLDTPSSIEKLARLTDAGVSAFIDLTEDHEPLKPYAYLLNGPLHERFAIRDQRVPETDELTRKALDAIDRHLRAGETVYVHCWGGVGRTGTIIGCWLSRHYEPGQPALDRVRELWKKNPKHQTRSRSPENNQQDRYVLAWGAQEVSVSVRYQGCLTGLAVGDAVGTTVEFRAPGSFERVSDMVGGGPFHLEVGQWTDDTSMALCLAESLVTREGYDAESQMELYVRWWCEGYLSSTGSCFDIGNATADALRRYRQSGHALAGSTDPQTAGNGSRCAWHRWRCSSRRSRNRPLGCVARVPARPTAPERASTPAGISAG